MKLSVAIRLGAMLRPQGFGNSAICWNAGHHTCALGAAAEACGIGTSTSFHGLQSDYEALKAAWPQLHHGAACPACGSNISMLAIWHLNDVHGWTRERIADWVATIEPQEVAAPIEAPQHQEAAS